jgi:hypothetical protein
MRTLIAVLVLCLTVSASASEERVREIVALFSKSKNVQKQKHGVLKSLFIEKHGEPVTGRDVSGRYEVPGLDLSLRITGSSGSGVDHRGVFTLRDVRRKAALFTATKVYTSGRTAPLEGVFMNLVTRAGKTAADATTTRTFGLGVALDEPLVLDGGTELQRVFYELQ